LRRRTPLLANRLSEPSDSHLRGARLDAVSGSIRDGIRIPCVLLLRVSAEHSSSWKQRVCPLRRYRCTPDSARGDVASLLQAKFRGCLTALEHSRYQLGREPVIRILTSLLAVSCQSGLVDTLATGGCIRHHIPFARRCAPKSQGFLVYTTVYVRTFFWVDS
jgi:hypothetical protein